MKYEIREIERKALVNFLTREGFTIKHSNKFYISFVNTNIEYVISNSSKYDWHITFKNIGNTWAPYKRCMDLMSAIYKNKDKFK